MVKGTHHGKQKRIRTGSLRAVILAGGLGTRLRPVVSHVPKTMAPVGQRPFLSYLLDWLQDQGIRRVLLCTGYLGEQIEACYGSGYGRISLSYCREEKPMGTGGALALASGLIDSAHLLVLNGDSFCQVDLGHFLEWHLGKGACASLVTVRRPDAGRYGRVSFSRSGRVTAFEEKQQQNIPGWINGGIYLFRSRAIAELERKGPFSIEYDLLPSLLARGLFAFRSRGGFIDIGTPEDYRRAGEFFAARRHAESAGQVSIC